MVYLQRFPHSTKVELSGASLLRLEVVQFAPQHADLGAGTGSGFMARSLSF